MRVLVTKIESESRKGEILVPVRSPGGEMWLAGISSNGEADSAEVVDMAISEADLFEFQGIRKASTQEDIDWMLEEVRKYNLGTEVGMRNGKFYSIQRTQGDTFWRLMLIACICNCVASLFFLSAINVAIACTLLGCVISYRALR